MKRALFNQFFVNGTTSRSCASGHLDACLVFAELMDGEKAGAQKFDARRRHL